MRALSLLVALATLLAGCASEPSTPAAIASPTPPAEDVDVEPGAEAERPDAGVEPPPPARVVAAFTNGTLTSVGAGSGEPVSVCCPSARASGENVDGVFTPDVALAGVVVELVWIDGTYDLDLWLYGPDHEQLLVPEANGTSISGSRGHMWYAADGQVGAPDGHVAIVVVEPEALALAGEWGWGVTSKTAPGVPFLVVVSLFYGEAPPEGYRAGAL